MRVRSCHLYPQSDSKLTPTYSLMMMNALKKRMKRFQDPTEASPPAEISDSNTMPSHPKPGSVEYDEHIQEEIEHFSKLFAGETARETLFYAVPPSWCEVEVRASNLIRTATGKDMTEHLVERLGNHPDTRMLSLGAGSCGVEITIAQLARSGRITCVDINAELLGLGCQRAGELGLNLTSEQADLNTVELPEKEFDLVFCHAALHHVIELERLTEQIKRTLRPGGALITADVITRNGYLMWPETREVVRQIWKTLPERFRVNHTAYAEPQLDAEIWEVDTSAETMECIRSEDILPILNRSFAVESFVPYFALSRRFFDTMYGPNYDLESPLDKSLLEWIWQLDLHYLSTRTLRPETFFGIYRSET